MKFAGNYFMYSLFMFLGRETVEAIRIDTLILLTISSLFIFLIAKKLFNGFSALVGVVVFASLNATVGGEGIMSNAEHFVVFFAITGIYFLIKNNRVQHWHYTFVSGILLSLSVIMKQLGY